MPTRTFSTCSTRSSSRRSRYAASTPLLVEGLPGDTKDVRRHGEDSIISRNSFQEAHALGGKMLGC